MVGSKKKAAFLVTSNTGCSGIRVHAFEKKLWEEVSLGKRDLQAPKGSTVINVSGINLSHLLYEAITRKRLQLNEYKFCSCGLR